MSANLFSRKAWLSLCAVMILGTGGIAGWSTAAFAVEVKVTLVGEQETPPVKSAGTGTGSFTIGDDGSVSGSVTTTGIAGTAAHLHEEAPGKIGKVIVPLTKNGDTYSTAAGAKLTAAQMASFKAGNVYVNVHTAANPIGELRAQLKP